MLSTLSTSYPKSSALQAKELKHEWSEGVVRFRDWTSSGGNCPVQGNKVNWCEQTCQMSGCLNHENNHCQVPSKQNLLLMLGTPDNTHAHWRPHKATELSKIGDGWVWVFAWKLALAGNNTQHSILDLASMFVTSTMLVLQTTNVDVRRCGYETYFFSTSVFR